MYQSTMVPTPQASRSRESFVKPAQPSANLILRRCDMQLKPFLLDIWLDSYEHDIEFNLASSEGPRWTVNALLNLAGEEERQRFLNHELVYGRPAGADGLREAIA